MNKFELMEYAKKAQKNAYAPYSNFKVGAALLSQEGKVYLGCNIENASFGATICAERAALSNAVANGERKFKALALVGSNFEREDERIVCTPCGICRQMLSEFCKPDFQIFLLEQDESISVHTIEDMLPLAFNRHSFI